MILVIDDLLAINSLNCSDFPFLSQNIVSNGWTFVQLILNIVTT